MNVIEDSLLLSVEFIKPLSGDENVYVAKWTKYFYLS